MIDDPRTSKTDAALDRPDEFTIDRCGNCQFRVALRRPTPILHASPWRCRRCQAVFLASAQERDGKPFSAGTRAAFYFEVLGEFAHATAEGAAEISEQDVLRLRECLADGFRERPELRRHRRFPLSAPVTVLPLSSDLRIVDEVCVAIAINVSAGGLAVLHGLPIEQPYFAVDFSQGSTVLAPVLLEKLRTRTAGGAFEIAGKFVSRIEY